MGIDIRFDGPPAHESGRFVEVEVDGIGVRCGTWVQDGDYWILRITRDEIEQAEMDARVRKILDARITEPQTEAST